MPQLRLLIITSLEGCTAAASLSCHVYACMQAPCCHHRLCAELLEAIRLCLSCVLTVLAAQIIGIPATAMFLTGVSSITANSRQVPSMCIAGATCAACTLIFVRQVNMRQAFHLQIEAGILELCACSAPALQPASGCHILL